MAASSATSRPSPRREWRSRRPGSWDSWLRRWVWRKCHDLLSDRFGHQGVRSLQPDHGCSRAADAHRAPRVRLDAGSPRPEPRRPARDPPAGRRWVEELPQGRDVAGDLPIGFLYILAIGSLGVYGIVLAGWSSNNKYALLGGLRASAQMISYEIAMGMSTVAVLLVAGNVTLSQVIAQQQQGGWFIIPLTLAFIMFFISALAETNRLPFDLPEAEGELIAGYHTEYSAMKFSMFYIAEYSNMVTASALMATLFFGGWDIPFTSWDSTGDPSVVKTLATLAVFGLKTFVFLFTYIWVRWTLPRFRYDQLMALGWKVLLPLALLYITVLAVAIWFVRVQLGWDYGTRLALLLFGLNVVLLVPLVWWLDRGRLISGSM